MKLSEKTNLNFEERERIRLVMALFQRGVVIAARELADEEILLCLKQALGERYNSFVRSL